MLSLPAYCLQKDAEKDVFVPTDELTAAQTILIPDKQTKTVATALSFKNLDAIDHISVTKSGAVAIAVK
ncbi:hypothetical protein LWM68_46620 [Niabella sp. W65]|nr:hypothetical protein [Niabella sp. W65]MCH7369548.1 hypothetical protein [Niabella sp. W65]ULT45089.1 hypothetical protein KRR40_18395 [Niabella sp. I65]